MFTFIDLFSGCGGLSLGLMQAGGKGIFAVERHPHAFETLKQNLCGNANPEDLVFDWPSWLPRQNHDICEINKNYVAQLKSLRGEVDVVAGGPPCQGFSFSGRRDASDPRNRMLFEFVTTVELVQPKFALVENVVGLNTPLKSIHKKSKKVSTINFGDRLRSQLSKIGYCAETFVVDAADCGVPQTRRRLITVAVRKDLISANKPDIAALWNIARSSHLQQLGFDPTKPIGVKAAISDLEIDFCGTTQCTEFSNFLEIKHRKPRTAYQKLMGASVSQNFDARLPRHKLATIEKFKYLQAHCVPGKSLTSKQRTNTGRKKLRQAVLAARKPSPTLTTLPDDLIHYSEPRILTVREYARLQSFPDWFRFYGSYTTGGERRLTDCPRYTQVGNAVPVLLAKALGGLLHSLMTEFLSSRSTAELNSYRGNPTKVSKAGT